MSIFDNLDLGGGANPFAFLSAAQPQADATAAPAAPAAAGLAGTALAAPDAPDAPDPPPAGAQGFLSKLTSPSPEGLTFGDKLFALGSILHGDSAGAQSYLEKKTAAVAKTRDDANKAQSAQAAANVLANSANPDGTLNIQKYLQGMAALGTGPDDKILAATYAHNIPHNVPVQGPRGGFSLVNENAGAGANPVTFTRPSDPLPPAKPGLLMEDPDNPGSFIANPDYIAAMGQLKDVQAAATAAHRAPPRGRATVRKSYGAGEVNWGSP